MKLSQVSYAFFGNKLLTNQRIKLYGCIPALSELGDLDKLIIFGKNDDKINMDYLTSRSLNSFFDTEEEGEEELV